MTNRQKAARKAARTRAQRRAEMNYYWEVTHPGDQRLTAIVNYLLSGSLVHVRLRWNPTRDTGRRLKHGVRYGRLVAVTEGGLLKVLPDGYKRPMIFHPSFWELWTKSESAGRPTGR